ncbi:hypothetical protein TNCV_3695971 [Trichonephila clavipes]|nr:hypothetical protein TNCV_3695971 [Trichonephila clavipes]
MPVALWITAETGQIAGHHLAVITALSVHGTEVRLFPAVLNGQLVVRDISVETASDCGLGEGENGIKTLGERPSLLVTWFLFYDESILSEHVFENKLKKAEGALHSKA